MLPTPFDFPDSLSDEQLNFFTKLIMYDENEGISYKKLDYLSETLKTSINNNGISDEKPITGYVRVIERHNRIKKLTDAKTTVHMMDMENDSQGGVRSPYGYINADLAYYINSKTDESKTVKVQDDFLADENVKDTHRDFLKLEERLKVTENIDLGVVVSQALAQEKEAVVQLKGLTDKYKFLGAMLETLLKAQAKGEKIFQWEEQ